MYYCIPIKDDTLCEITEQKFVSTDGSTFLLVNCDAFSCASETVTTKRNQYEVELDVRNADINPYLDGMKQTVSHRGLLILIQSMVKMEKVHIRIIKEKKYLY